jgi:hypothetical protein
MFSINLADEMSAFAWDAAKVQAVAAHLVALDERDAPAESSGAGGSDQTGRAGADDDDVILTFPLVSFMNSSTSGDMENPADQL